MTTLSKAVAAATQAEINQRYTLIGYEEIQVGAVQANPRNPRPNFMLDDADPYLAALGDSIKTDGQHQAATVYELVGHYEEPDQPGQYRLLQGESRWRACRIAKVQTLRCHIVATPTSLAEELEWLGNEEAFKRDWGTFFRLRHAVYLAEELGVPVDSTEISGKTGVSLRDLRLAKKATKLVPEVQALVAEYEELLYQQTLLGLRPRGSRLTGSRVRTAEFPVGKAAIVYDVFEALRTNIPQIVREFSDEDLQHLIAKKASRTPLADLEKLNGSIRQAGKNPPAGLIAQLSELISNPARDIKTTLKETGSSEAELVEKFIKQADTIIKNVRRMTARIDQLGVEEERYVDAQMRCLKMQRDIATLEDAIEKRIELLRRSRR